MKRVLPKTVRTVCCLVGVVVLTAAASADEWVTNIIDNQGDVGAFASLTTDPNGDFVIAYRSNTASELRLAHIAGSHYTLESVPDTPGGGRQAALAISSWGEYEIAHRAYDDLLFSYKGLSGDWASQTLVQYGGGKVIARSLALALDVNDMPHLVYVQDEFDGPLRYATYDPQTNNWTDQLIYEGPAVIPSVAIDNQGRVVAASGNRTTGRILVYRQQAGLWHALPEIEGFSPSMALAPTGQIALAYVLNNQLYYRTYDVAGWTGPVLVDDAEQVQVGAAGPCLRFDPQGRPSIAYVATHLKFASNQIGWTIQTVNTLQDSAINLSLAFYDVGLPAIAYYSTTLDLEGTSLKLAGPALTPTCPADLDHNTAVNLLDFALFADTWLTNTPALPTDFSGNGLVDYPDLAVFQFYWLWTP